MNITKALARITLILGLATSSIASVVDNQKNDPVNYPNLHIINHPLIKSKLTMMRDKRTSSQELRRLLGETATLIGFEVTKNLPTKEIDVDTPVTKMKGQKLKNHIVLVPILRAGLGMVDGIHKFMPEADVAHIGMFKDHLTKKAVEYLSKLPEIKDQIFIIIDPEISSGNSAISTIDRLTKSGVSIEKILFMSLVVLPEGIEKLYLKYPTIPIYAASLDGKTNEQASNSSGLGDFGDKLFGTKQ